MAQYTNMNIIKEKKKVRIELQDFSDWKYPINEARYFLMTDEQYQDLGTHLNELKAQFKRMQENDDTIGDDFQWCFSELEKSYPLYIEVEEFEFEF